MAFSDIRFEQEQRVEGQLQTRRSEKARAFREYMDAKTQAGEDVDPYEMDMVRMKMVGGDPYMASQIPSGDALKEMTKQANKRSQLTRLKLNADMADQRGLEREYVQKIIDDNWDKSDTEMSEVFASTFGEDGIRIYDQYKPEMNSMLSEATNKKYAKLAQNPAAQMVKTKEDLYRYFPAEMRNPKTAAILQGMVEENSRARNIDDFRNMNDGFNKLPDFMKSEDMKEFAKDFMAQSTGYANDESMPDGGSNLARMMDGINTQRKAQQDASLINLASKDPYFAVALKSGDEESLFSATKSLMVQAGMQAPENPEDPRYIEAQKSLGLVGRAQAVATYNQRKSQLSSAVIDEMGLVKKNSTKRIQAVQDASFSDDMYKKNDVLDERITQVLNLLGTNPNFFPSENNIRNVVSTIKQEFAKDAEKFNPEVVTGMVLDDPSMETMSQAVDRRVSEQLEVEYGIPPGTNFNSEYSGRTKTLLTTMDSYMQTLTEPAQNIEEYNVLMEDKFLIQQEIQNEIRNIENVIEMLNSDPAKRSSISNFDYNSAMGMLSQLNGKLDEVQDIQIINPTNVPDLNDRESYTDALSEIRSLQSDIDRAKSMMGNGITEADRMNPEAQRVMASYFTLENAQALYRKTGKIPNERDLYAAHFFGAEGASKVINNKNNFVIAKDLFPEAAEANKNIFYRDGVPLTVAQVYDKLTGKVYRQLNK